jgi:hypothetical protein
MANIRVPTELPKRDQLCRYRCGIILAACCCSVDVAGVVCFGARDRNVVIVIVVVMIAVVVVVVVVVVLVSAAAITLVVVVVVVLIVFHCAKYSKNANR